MSGRRSEGGGAAGPVEVEAGDDACGGVGGEVFPEDALVLIVAALFCFGIEVESGRSGISVGGVGEGSGLAVRIGRGVLVRVFVGEGHGLALLFDVGVDGFFGALDIAHLAEGFEAGAHEGGHGAGLADVDGALVEGEGDMVEIDEDGVVVLDPDAGDEGDHVEFFGGEAGLELAAGALEALVVVETELLVDQGGVGAASAAGFDEAAAVFVGWDKVRLAVGHGNPLRDQGSGISEQGSGLRAQGSAFDLVVEKEKAAAGAAFFAFFLPILRIPSYATNCANFVGVSGAISPLRSEVITLVWGRGS
jgi:hypothetical protein